MPTRFSQKTHISMALASAVVIAAVIGAFAAGQFYSRLIAINAALWAIATLIWLCCLAARGKGHGRHLLSVFLLFVLVWVAFWNSLRLNPSRQSGWTLDNLYIIKFDPRHRADSWSDKPGPLSPGVKQIFMQDYWWPKGISGLFRPITTFTYWLNFTAFGNGEDTTYYHVVNFYLHWANAALVYALVYMLLKRWEVALLAGAIFAVHPITTESVTNIIGRADQFAALVVLSGLLAWARADGRPGWRRLPWLIGVMLITAFGVFAKESALAIGIIILAYDFVYRWSPRFARFFGISVGLILLTLVTGFSFADLPWQLSTSLRISAAGVLLSASLLTHILLAPPGTETRGGALGGALLLAILASIFHPFAGAVTVLLVAIYELLFNQAIWEDAPDLWRVRWWAVWYTAVFVLFLGFPYLMGMWFSRLGWTQTLTVGENYARASIAAGAGIAIYLALRWAEFPFRLLGLILPFAAAIIASFYVMWMGLVATFTIGLIELIKQTFAPPMLLENQSWKSLRQRFITGYFLLLPPALAMYFVRAWVFANSTPPETPFLDNPLRGGPFDPLPFWQSRMTAVKVIGKLVYLLFWPVHLSSDNSYDEIPLFDWNLLAVENLKTIVALAFVVFCIILAIRSYRDNKPLCFLILFFFAALLPTSNLIQLIGSIMAERFMYLPLIGFAGAIAIVAAMALERLVASIQSLAPSIGPLRGAIYAGIPAVVITLFVARSFVRNYDWFSDVTLWRAAEKVSPKSFRCYQSLAFALYEEHARHHIDEIIEIAEKARPIVDPLPDEWNSSRLYLHLGMYYSIKGDVVSRRGPQGEIPLSEINRPWYLKSKEVLEHASKIDRAFNQVNYRRQIARGDKPDDILDVGLTPVYSTLATAYYKLGMDRESINAARYQIHLEPSVDPEPYFRIALSYIRMQRFDEAAMSLIQCLLIDNNRTDAWQFLLEIYNLGGPNAAGAIDLRNPAKPRLVFDHPIVRDHLRDALRDLIRILRRSKRTGAAEQMRKLAIENYGYPASIFHSLFTEPVPKVTPQGLEFTAMVSDGH